jgi:hypothetical protein
MIAVVQFKSSHNGLPCSRAFVNCELPRDRHPTPRPSVATMTDKI